MSVDERSAFLDAIRANPRDLATRKIFADWLDEHDEPEEADKQRGWTHEKQDSLEWLEEFARQATTDPYAGEDEDRSLRLSAEELISRAHGFLDRKVGDWDDEDPEGWVFLGFDTPDVVWEKREQFWHHFQVVTGRSPSDEQRQEMFFSCAC